MDVSVERVINWVVGECSNVGDLIEEQDRSLESSNVQEDKELW